MKVIKNWKLFHIPKKYTSIASPSLCYFYFSGTYKSRQILKSIVDPVHQHANPSWNRELLKDEPLKLRPLTFDTYTQYIYKTLYNSKQGAMAVAAAAAATHNTFFA